MQRDPDPAFNRQPVSLEFGAVVALFCFGPSANGEGGINGREPDLIRLILLLINLLQDPEMQRIPNSLLFLFFYAVIVLFDRVQRRTVRCV